MATQSKRVMSFSELVAEYEKVAPWPTTLMSDDDDEADVKIFGTDRPMVHSYLNDPTERMVLTSGVIMEQRGEGVLSLSPIGLPYLMLRPASVKKIDGGIVIDTLDRDTDSFIRPLVIEDSQWAIGSESETMMALLNALKEKDVL
jgi:hypothetical protein